MIKTLNRAAFIGILSGILLGLFLKAVEDFTRVKVYTLLLNVDYIPILQNYEFPESVEFFFHIIISVLVSVIFIQIILARKWTGSKIITFTTAASVIIGLLLFPTTMLSDRTPPITSFSAWFYWLLGHGIYGWVLGVLLNLVKVK